MSNIWRGLVKQLADALISTTNNKVILFTKQLSDLAERLRKSGMDNKPVKDESGMLQRDWYKENLKFNENIKSVTVDKTEQNSSRADENKRGLSTDEINGRISSLLSSARESTSRASLLKRLENLNNYLKKHPEGIEFANQIGTPATLFKLKRKVRDADVGKVLDETLSLIGQCEPLRSSGVRVLSIDGGGMRGLVVINTLQRLELRSGRKIHQLFDYICGVSTGAIIACCCVPPITLPLQKLRKLYLLMGRQIFCQNALKGAGKLVFSGAYYETSVWEKLLKEYVGNVTLLETNRFPECPKICVLSTVGNRRRVVPFLFRNYSHPDNNAEDYPGSCTNTIFEALRASAAAPSVFEEFRTEEHLHLDGGLVANNPSGVAIHEVKSLWPEEHISCLVSCGTGKSPHRFDKSRLSSSWKGLLDKVLESATDTESVHTILGDLLDKDTYYRFNPTLSSTFAIDEVSDEKIVLLEEETETYLIENEEKISAVTSKLMEPRSLIDRWRDRIAMLNKRNESVHD